ncbi:MAG: hypothetical protein ACTS5R_00255 [Candidatus Hodgkinia cicadicola]
MINISFDASEGYVIPNFPATENEGTTNVQKCFRTASDGKFQ